MHSRVQSSCGYGEKYHGLMRCFPNSINWIFFILVTTSSWWVTILPDCLGVFSSGSCESSSSDGMSGVGVAGVSGVRGGADSDGAFLFRLIFFWRAAASTALPLTWTSGMWWWIGLVGRDVEMSRFGVDTPVVFWPVVKPSFRGNWTFLVSRSSSGTHSSNRLLTKKLVEV